MGLNNEEQLDSWVAKFIATHEDIYYTRIFNSIEHIVKDTVKYRTRDDPHTSNFSDDIISFVNEKIYLALKQGKYKKYDGVKFTNWVITTVINSYKYHKRYHSKFIPFETNCHQTEPDIFSNNIQDKANNILHYIENVLTSEQSLREVGVLYFINNAKIGDISKALGISTSSVNNKIRKIRDQVINNVECLKD